MAEDGSMLLPPGTWKLYDLEITRDLIDNITHSISRWPLEQHTFSSANIVAHTNDWALVACLSLYG